MAVKITIISTIYKAENTLRRLLDSCLQQKSKEIEFLLIDNGSPDHCGDICEEYAKHDDRFKVHHLKENIGYIGARNWALERVEGEYIGFADSDDYLESESYDKLIDIIERSKPDYIVCAHTKFNDNNVFIKEPLQYKTGLYTGKQLLNIKKSYIGMDRNTKAMPGFMWRCLYKNEIIKNNKLVLHEDFIPMEDNVFNFDYALNCNNIYIYNHPIYYFYTNPTSVTKTIEIDWYIQYLKIYRYKSNKLKGYVEIPEIRELLANDFANSAVYSLYVRSTYMKFNKYVKYVSARINTSDVKDIFKQISFVSPQIEKLYKYLYNGNYFMFCASCRLIKTIKTIIRK